MQAWQLTAHGSPEKVLQLCELPDPAPKPSQVLIRSEGFGLNFADVMAVKGLYRDAPPVPCVIGYEVVGRVERCGASVPEGLLGKRVLAFTRFGGYARLACTDHRAAVPIPDDLDLGTALAMATQGATAWHMAMAAAPVQQGDRVLVHSAAGGVGQLLLQIALHQGCEVFFPPAGSPPRDPALQVEHLSLKAECALVAQGPTELIGIIGGGDPAGVLNLHARPISCVNS